MKNIICIYIYIYIDEYIYTLYIYLYIYIYIYIFVNFVLTPFDVCFCVEFILFLANSIFRNLILSVSFGLHKIQLFDLAYKLTD